MKFFKDMSDADARHLALLCAGFAVLLGVAYLLAGPRSAQPVVSVQPQTQTASWLSCWLGWSNCGPSMPERRCTINVTPRHINVGESATISWGKGGNLMKIKAFEGTTSKDDKAYREWKIGENDNGDLDPLLDNGNAESGSITVTPPFTTTYWGTGDYGPNVGSQSCEVTLPVVGGGEGDVLARPLVTIASDAPVVSGIPTLALGSSTVITATFTAQGEGTTIDTLVAAAINGPNSTESALKGNDWDEPISPKRFTFSPEQAGDYTFTPAVRTLFFRQWNDYEQSVTVRVVAKAGTDVCRNIDGIQSGPPANAYVAGNNCQCEPGFSLDGDMCASEGEDMCPGADFPGMQFTLPPNAQVEGDSCSCQDDYSLVSGQCIASTVTEFYANPSLLQKGKPTTLYWKVINPPKSCTITGTNGSSNTIQKASLSAGSLQTAAINEVTIFTMKCGKAPVQQATVRLIPVFEER